LENPQTLHDRSAQIVPPADNIDRTLEFRALAEMIPALVFMTDREGSNIYVNAQFQRYCGIAGASLLGEGWLAALHPDDRLRAAETWRRTWALGEPYDVRYRFRKFDGEYRWHLVRGMPLKGADGTVVRWIGACTDVDDLVSSVSLLGLSGDARGGETDLKRLSREIALLKAQIDAISDICWIADDRGTILSVNESWRASSAAPPVEAAFGDLISDDSHDAFATAWSFALETRDILDVEVQIHDALTGGIRSARATAFPVRVDLAGEVENYWVGTIS
jgi:PAS domain S-box-containing protein